MHDIRIVGSKGVEVVISADGKTLWVNAEGQDEICVLRIQGIEKLELVDYRTFYAAGKEEG